MFGQRLKLARKKAGLSMRRLADQLAPPLSAQAISKYENGQMMPSSSVMAQLGRVLGTSIDFLMAAQVAELQGIEFRKGSRVSARDRALAEAVVTEKLEDYLAIEAILDLPPQPDQFGKLRKRRVASYDEAEQLAIALRGQWQLGLDPVPGMSHLLEDKGIRVIEADLPAKIDGLACAVELLGEQNKTEVIVVSRNTGIERRRFNLAHELAHRVIAEVGPNIDKEKAMHRFGGAFLAPAEHLRDAIGDRRHGMTYHEIRRLKHCYGVSAAAILMRMKDLKILPAGSVEYAFRTYARTWRRREPDPIAFNQGIGAFERPGRFKNLVWRALGDQLISPARAAQLLQRPLKNVEQDIRGPRSA